MKIHNNSPVSGQSSSKIKKSSSNGVFGTLLEAEIGEAHRTDSTDGSAPVTSQAPEQEAWKALNESISLLDQAMKSLESGEAPSKQMMQDIEQLRSQVQQHLSSGPHNHKLREADTMLAVEAERIRSLQS